MRTYAYACFGPLFPLVCDVPFPHPAVFNTHLSLPSHHHPSPSSSPLLPKPLRERAPYLQYWSTLYFVNLFLLQIMLLLLLTKWAFSNQNVPFMQPKSNSFPRKYSLPTSHPSLQKWHIYSTFLNALIRQPDLSPQPLSLELIAPHSQSCWFRPPPHTLTDIHSLITAELQTSSKPLFQFLWQSSTLSSLPPAVQPPLNLPRYRLSLVICHREESTQHQTVHFNFCIT